MVPHRAQLLAIVSVFWGKLLLIAHRPNISVTAGVQLASTALIPNIAIRKMAQDWVQAHPAYQQQHHAQDAPAAGPDALKPHQMPSTGSTGFDTGPCADQSNLRLTFQEVPSAPLSLQSQASAVLAAAASLPGTVGASYSFSDCGSSSLLVQQAASSAAVAAAGAAAQSTDAAAKAAAHTTHKAAQGAAYSSYTAAQGAARSTGMQHSKSMPTKGSESKAGSSSSSFSLGDLQATLQQSAETREKMTAARDSSGGLFSSRSGKKEGSGLNLREEEGLAVGVMSGSEAGNAPRSSSGSMRKGSFGKGLMGALKSMKHSFVSSISVTNIHCYLL